MCCGKRLFPKYNVWSKESDCLEDVDAITFSRIDNWEQKYQQSKKGLGVRTPRRSKILIPAI